MQELLKDACGMSLGSLSHDSMRRCMFLAGICWAFPNTSEESLVTTKSLFRCERYCKLWPKYIRWSPARGMQVERARLEVDPPVRILASQAPAGPRRTHGHDKVKFLQLTNSRLPVWRSGSAAYSAPRDWSSLESPE